MSSDDRSGGSRNLDCFPPWVDVLFIYLGLFFGAINIIVEDLEINKNISCQNSLDLKSIQDKRL